MNVGDILIRVKRQFGDESGVQITNDDIYRWINDGQRQIVLQNEGLLEKRSTAASVDGQQEYDLPDDLLILRRIHFKASGEESHYRLKRFSIEELDEYVDGWDGTSFGTAKPAVSAVYAGKLLLFPTPASSIVDGIKLYYNRKPMEVTAESDIPELPELYHEAIVKYCLQKAYEIDEDWEASNIKSTQMASDISLLRGRDDWKQQGTYPTITVLPEDRDW